MAGVYTLIQAVIQQSRLVTATGSFIDAFAADFFGASFLRWGSEADFGYRQRVMGELLRPRGTRAAITAALIQLTGRVPQIFEPALTTDTGGYSIGGVGYGMAGGWGNLNLPYQFFLTVFRPSGGAIALFAGYGTGGFPVYGNLNMEGSTPDDGAIFASVPPLLPVATTAWCRILG